MKNVGVISQFELGGTLQQDLVCAHTKFQVSSALMFFKGAPEILDIQSKVPTLSVFHLKEHFMSKLHTRIATNPTLFSNRGSHFYRRKTMQAYLPVTKKGTRHA